MLSGISGRGDSGGGSCCFISGGASGVNKGPAGFLLLAFRPLTDRRFPDVPEETETLTGRLLARGLLPEHQGSEPNGYTGNEALTYRTEHQGSGSSLRERQLLSWDPYVSSNPLRAEEWPQQEPKPSWSPLSSAFNNQNERSLWAGPLAPA